MDIENVFPGWRNEGQIGAGSYGQVYRVTKEALGHISESAVKVIKIPCSDSEVVELARLGMDSLSIREYFESTAKSIVEEIGIMDSLSGAENIVTIQDYKLLEHEDGIGWTIWIRMELLESLTDYQKRAGNPSVEESVKIAIDACSALDVCSKHNIVHRDVKPENMFRDRFGNYKLGDFGIAKQIGEKSVTMLSQRGTMAYMAPEILRGGKYDGRVDIYSLGIMLYRFLNDMRMPFLPPLPHPITQGDIEAATTRRLRGERFPAPAHADGELARIVLKACEADPGARYASADEMRRDLLNWLSQAPKVEPKPKSEPKPSPVPAPLSKPEHRPELKPEPAPEPEPKAGTEPRRVVHITKDEPTKKKRVPLALVIIAGMILFGAVAAAAALLSGGGNAPDGADAGKAGIAAGATANEVTAASEPDTGESAVTYLEPTEKPQVAATNLSPFFSVPGGDQSYWIKERTPYICYELEQAGIAANGYALGNGWAHFDTDGRVGIAPADSDEVGSYRDCCYNNLWVVRNESLKPLETYTFLIEIRNCRFDTGRAFCIWPVTRHVKDDRQDQFYNAAEAVITGDGEYRIVAQALDSFAGSTRMTDGYIYVDKNTSVSFDVRISLYEGVYEGDYVPFN